MFGLTKRKRAVEPLPAPTERCGFCGHPVLMERMPQHFTSHIRLIHREDHAGEEVDEPFRNARRPRLAVYQVDGGGYSWSVQAQETMARAVGYLHAQHPPHAEFQIVPHSYSNQSVSRLMVYIRY